MDSELMKSILQGVVGGSVTGAAAWAVINVKIEWLRADINRAHKRIDKIET